MIPGPRPVLPMAGRRGEARRTGTVTETVLLDNFTTTTINAGASQLVDHGPDLGGGWLQHSSYTVRSFNMDTAGRLYANGSTSTACWYMMPMPLHADGDASIWIDRVTVSATETPSIAARISSSANTMIFARYNGVTDNIDLLELVAGSAVTSVSASGVSAWTAASEHKITLRLRGSQASVLLDDVEVIPATTMTTVLSNGYVGVRHGAGAGSGASTGFHTRKISWIDASGKGGFPNAEPAKDAPSLVRVKPFPTRMHQYVSLNGIAFQQSNVVVYNGNQYAVWNNSSNIPIIGKRSLPNGDWSTFDLSTIAANPLDTPTLQDQHNSYSIGIGSDGYIHVAGNMHDVTLNYVRSTNPEDITAWVATGAPSGTVAVTYPQFLPLTSGNLLLFTRNGVSGNGDVRVSKWNSTTHAWAAAVKILDGNPSNESPYINMPAERSGVVHLFCCWRASSGSADTNEDICHIMSADEGATWTDISGGALVLPILHSAVPKVLDTAASGSGMINQLGADVDTSGKPHAVFFLYDGSTKTQAYHVYWDGAAWHVDAATAWTYKFDMTSSFSHDPARPAVFCPNDGSTWFLLRHNVNDSGTTYALKVGPTLDSTKRVIWRAPTYYSEATISTTALRLRSEVTFIAVPGAPSFASNADIGAMQWGSVNGYLCTVDVNDLPNLPSA